MICCNTYTDLGCLNSCDPIKFGTTTQTGTYKLDLSFNNITYTKSQTFTSIGSNIIFNDVILNENYYYLARVTFPDNTYICYKFKTKINL